MLQNDALTSMGYCFEFTVCSEPNVSLLPQWKWKEVARYFPCIPLPLTEFTPVSVTSAEKIIQSSFFTSFPENALYKDVNSRNTEIL